MLVLKHGDEMFQRQNRPEKYWCLFRLIILYSLYTLYFIVLKILTGVPQVPVRTMVTVATILTCILVAVPQASPEHDVNPVGDQL